MVKLMVNCNNLEKRQNMKKKMALTKTKPLTDAFIVHGKTIQVLTNTSFEYPTITCTKRTGYINNILHIRITPLPQVCCNY